MNQFIYAENFFELPYKQFLCSISTTTRNRPSLHYKLQNVRIIVGRLERVVFAALDSFGKELAGQTHTRERSEFRESGRRTKGLSRIMKYEYQY